MKKILIAIALAAGILSAGDVTVYPKDTLAKILQNQKGIVENGMLNAIKKTRDKYIAGFIVKFDEAGNIIIKAITVNGGRI